jgi:predicted phosphodiesterase
MKLHVLSDLHLELYGFNPDAAAVRQADVIILAGDIDKGSRALPGPEALSPTSLSLRGG